MPQQLAFDVRGPLADVTVTGCTGQPLPPFQGTGPAQRHASLTGALVARAPSQAKRMLLWYLGRGPQTDHAVAVALGLPEARISARRSQLIASGCVEYLDLVEGEFGAKNCRWQLTDKGTAIAQRLST